MHVYLWETNAYVAYTPPFYANYGQFIIIIYIGEHFITYCGGAIVRHASTLEKTGPCGGKMGTGCHIENCMIELIVEK